MKRIPTLAGLLLVLATLLYCADATGKWKASLDVGGETHELNFDLKATTTR